MVATIVNIFQSHDLPVLYGGMKRMSSKWTPCHPPMDHHTKIFNILYDIMSMYLENCIYPYKPKKKKVVDETMEILVGRYLGIAINPYHQTSS
jgi:hypothetical protein